MMQRSFLLAATALLSLAGCKSNPAPLSSASAPTPKTAPAATPVDPPPAGTLPRIVHFNGAPPPRLSIDLTKDPARSLSGGDTLTEQYVVSKGGLANVFVYIKAGLPSTSAPAGAAPAHMDQTGCRYTPHVLAQQQGGSVVFTNSDPTMHNVHTMPAVVGNPGVDVSQGPGAQPATKQFPTPETMRPVRCNNHPWMSAFLNVAPNPFFAVSGPDGTFTLPALPPGAYTVAAVHEKLGEQDVQVTVPPHGAAHAAFPFGPQ